MGKRARSKKVAPRPLNDQEIAWGRFDIATKFQQLVSELVSHTEESIGQLEGHLEAYPDEEWATPLLDAYKSDLKNLRQFYAAARRHSSECGQHLIQVVNPIQPGQVVEDAPGDS